MIIGLMPAGRLCGLCAGSRERHGRRGGLLSHIITQQRRHQAAPCLHQAAPCLQLAALAPCESSLVSLVSLSATPGRKAYHGVLSYAQLARPLHPAAALEGLIKPSDNKPAVVRARHHRHSIHHAPGLMRPCRNQVVVLYYESISLPRVEPAGHASPHDAGSRFGPNRPSCASSKSARVSRSPRPNGGPNRDDFTAPNTGSRQAQLRGDSSRCIRRSHW